MAIPSKAQKKLQNKVNRRIVWGARFRVGGWLLLGSAAYTAAGFIFCYALPINAQLHGANIAIGPISNAEMINGLIALGTIAGIKTAGLTIAGLLSRKIGTGLRASAAKLSNKAAEKPKADIPKNQPSSSPINGITPAQPEIVPANSQKTGPASSNAPKWYIPDYKPPAQNIAVPKLSNQLHM